MKSSQLIYPNKSQAPLIMGIINITPDSFSDGSQYNSITDAVERAEQMVASGADILDIGGESTRPGAQEVSIEEEIDRVVPIIETIKQFKIPISIDTSKPEVMHAAVNAGAQMINDVRALQEPNALEMAAKLSVPVCLMHMQGAPRSMQNSPIYNNVTLDVIAFLKLRMTACENAGIKKELISIDPGFGFGKTLEHNLKLLNELNKLIDLGSPILVGLSRKSMLGQITGKKVNQRLTSSLAVALIAMQKGAKIVRVHDVEETHDVRQVYLALQALE
ncbi:MAG: dihydropteroate synthase [Gammaproteobacteria bacterium]|nr:MAG: dihydropteroate synthase [Gammaproteobacteria bacterium]